MPTSNYISERQKKKKAKEGEEKKIESTCALVNIIWTIK
jgi:hypothetical protein